MSRSEGQKAENCLEDALKQAVDEKDPEASNWKRIQGVAIDRLIRAKSTPGLQSGLNLISAFRARYGDRPYLQEAVTACVWHSQAEEETCSDPAGTAPIATITVSPEVKDDEGNFLVAVGDTLTFTATAPADLDCRCNENQVWEGIADTITDPDGFTFTVSQGSVSPSSGPSVTYTAPMQQATVSPSLALADDGDPYDDEDATILLAQGSVVTQEPIFIEQESKSTNSEGGESSLKVLDMNSAPFKKAGVTVMETLTNNRFIFESPGMTTVERQGADKDQSTGKQTDANGKFTDTPIAFSNDTDRSSTAAQNAVGNATTFTITWKLTHKYYMNINGARFDLIGTFNQKVIYHMKKDANGLWKTDRIEFESTPEQ